ncbi:hypothetical protein H7170_01900 [Candidatus Gracilibacteria bacterium]|nr:hypothetical protein [Candidatus Gracilibacteria bacterium]
MLKEAMNFHAEWMNRTGDPYDVKIEEIFYSKNYDSCIYQLSIYKYTGIDNNDGLGGKILLNRYLYDYFSKKEIITTVSKNIEDGKIKENEFDKKLKELKGE